MVTHTQNQAEAVTPRLRPNLGRALVVALALLPAIAAAQVVKTTDVPATLGEAYQRLIDPQRPLPERRAAAMALLNTGEQGRSHLASALGVGVSPIAWRAVAEAVALHPKDPPGDLAEPMLAILPKADAPTQAALAEALGRFTDRKLVEKLVASATDPGRATAERRGAILALGHHRTTEVAEHLINLSDLRQAEPLQEAAFQALTTLTGLDEYGRDRAAWVDWWNNARRWNQARWQERLMANLARRNAVHRQEQHVIEDRLLDSQRALYRTTTPEDRPAVLAYMLADALEPIRQLAIDLCLQRMVDEQDFDEPLRQALRVRLDDTSPNVRRRAALLLRDLGDAPAADRIADQLSRKSEANVSVLRAYLLTLTRAPRGLAVEPALELLEEPTLRGEAAGALAAAHDAGLLSRKQSQAAAKRIGKFLETNSLPPAPVATLLGQVGDEEDWRRIAGWIESGDAGLKRAAASAWANSDRSLKLLADRVGDPVIEPIVLAAAVRRGDDPWTLRALADHRPAQATAAGSWEQALVAMSGRVQPAVVLETVQRIEGAGYDASLLDRMLSAAIDRETPASATDLVPLLLKRGEMRLASASPAEALADYERVLALQAELPAGSRLSSDAVDRLTRGRIHAHLQVGQLDEAFDAARGLLGYAQPGAALPRTDDPIIDQFLDVARTHAEAGRREPARRMLTRLRLLLGPAIKPEVAQRIALLEAELVDRGGTQPVARDPEPDAERSPLPLPRSAVDE